MKRLLLFLLLNSTLANAVLPKFSVGDCIAEKRLERWEQVTNIYKVLEIGKNHYHLKFQTLKDYIYFGLPEGDMDTSIYWINSKYEKIECPK